MYFKQIATSNSRRKIYLCDITQSGFRRGLHTVHSARLNGITDKLPHCSALIYFSIPPLLILSLFLFAVVPRITLALGSNLNPDDIEEGDDVYFECKVHANPAAYKVVWKHNVSRLSMYKH